MLVMAARHIALSVKVTLKAAYTVALPAAMSVGGAGSDKDTSAIATLFPEFKYQRIYRVDEFGASENVE
jgi:hypothetical protein